MRLLRLLLAGRPAASLPGAGGAVLTAAGRRQASFDSHSKGFAGAGREYGGG